MKQYMKPTITRNTDTICEVMAAGSGQCLAGNNRKHKNGGCFSKGNGGKTICPFYDQCDR